MFQQEIKDTVLQAYAAIATGASRGTAQRFPATARSTKLRRREAPRAWRTLPPTSAPG